MNSIALCYFLFFKQMYQARNKRYFIMNMQEKTMQKIKIREIEYIYFEYLMNCVEQNC